MDVTFGYSIPSSNSFQEDTTFGCIKLLPLVCYQSISLEQRPLGAAQDLLALHGYFKPCQPSKRHCFNEKFSGDGFVPLGVSRKIVMSKTQRNSSNKHGSNHQCNQKKQNGVTPVWYFLFPIPIGILAHPLKNVNGNLNYFAFPFHHPLKTGLDLWGIAEP